MKTTKDELRKITEQATRVSNSDRSRTTRLGDRGQLELLLHKWQRSHGYKLGPLFYLKWSDRLFSNKAPGGNRELIDELVTDIHDADREARSYFSNLGADNDPDGGIFASE